MTQRGKFVKLRAIKYSENQKELKYEMIDQMKFLGLDPRKPSPNKFRISGIFKVKKRESVKDLSNLIKAIEDAGQGIIYLNDRQIRAYGKWEVMPHHRDDCLVSFEEMT